MESVHGECTWGVYTGSLHRGSLHREGKWGVYIGRRVNGEGIWGVYLANEHGECEMKGTVFEESCTVHERAYIYI